ncbi:tail fiber assembly protein [Escherichia coli]
MNASYAVIENGMVVNVIVWDGEDEFTVPDNLQLINISDISEQPGIGWAYSDGVFTAPLPPERSHDELVADAEQKKQSLIDAAMVNISVIQLKLQAGRKLTQATLYTILCKCLFSEVTVQAVTELDNKAAHCHTPVPQRHRPFL